VAEAVSAVVTTTTDMEVVAGTRVAPIMEEVTAIPVVAGIKEAMAVMVVTTIMTTTVEDLAQTTPTDLVADPKDPADFPREVLVAPTVVAIVVVVEWEVAVVTGVNHKIIIRIIMC